MGLLVIPSGCADQTAAGVQRTDAIGADSGVSTSADGATGEAGVRRDSGAPRSPDGVSCRTFPYQCTVCCHPTSPTPPTVVDYHQCYLPASSWPLASSGPEVSLTFPIPDAGLTPADGQACNFCDGPEDCPGQRCCQGPIVSGVAGGSTCQSTCSDQDSVVCRADEDCPSERAHCCGSMCQASLTNCNQCSGPNDCLTGQCCWSETTHGKTCRLGCASIVCNSGKDCPAGAPHCCYSSTSQILLCSEIQPAGAYCP